jgi:opacity protein-like surface antigen
MQRRTLLTCAILLVLTGIAAWAADVTGVWTGTISGGDGEYALTYTFKQDGQKLTGIVTGPTDPIPIQEGKVEGDKISFWLQVDMGGNVVKFTTTGTIKGDEITLTTTNDAGMDLGGAMTLKRQKQ